MENEKNNQKPRFVFSVMTQEDLPRCIQGLGKAFAQCQPFLSLNLELEPTTQFCRQITQIGYKRGISIVAKQQSTGKIAGCSVNFDIADQKLLTFSKLDMNSFGPLVDILHLISHDFLEQRGAFNTQGKWAHIWLMGVFDGFRRLGLTKMMLEESLKIFKQKGYQHACAQMTSPYTLSTFVKSTKYFKAIKEQPYNEFVYKGKKPMPNTPLGAVFVYTDLSKEFAFQKEQK